MSHKCYKHDELISKIKTFASKFEPIVFQNSKFEIEDENRSIRHEARLHVSSLAATLTAPALSRRVDALLNLLGLKLSDEALGWHLPFDLWLGLGVLVRATCFTNRHLKLETNLKQRMIHQKTNLLKN